jgi:hypothetical protein
MMHGLESISIQRRVSGTCAANSSISTINADGTAACQTDDDSGAAQVGDFREELAKVGEGPDEREDPVSFTKVKDVPADVVNRNADTLDGQNSTNFASANHDSSYIQRSPTSAENASIHISGTMRTGGTLRTGSETGTSQPPNFDGLVVRRIDSTNAAAGEVVARTYQVRLERDGTFGGLRIAWDAFSGGDNTTVNCMGINSLGGAVNHYSRPVPITGPAGTAQIFSDTQGLVYTTCSFGDSVFGHHVTQVTMQRAPGDNFWVGTVLSSFNQ